MGIWGGRSSTHTLVSLHSFLSPKVWFSYVIRAIFKYGESDLATLPSENPLVASPWLLDFHLRFLPGLLGPPHPFQTSSVLTLVCSARHAFFLSPSMPQSFSSQWLCIYCSFWVKRAFSSSPLGWLLLITQVHPQSYLHAPWVLPSPSCQPTSALAPRPTLDFILLGFSHSIITIGMFPIFKFVFLIAYLPHSHVNSNVNS